MKIGSTFELADCKHCGERIKHEFWGGGGNMWVHKETDAIMCYSPPNAQPDPTTIRPVVSK